MIELFAGIGAFRQALKNQNIANECIEIAELFNQVLSNKIGLTH